MSWWLHVSHVMKCFNIYIYEIIEHNENSRQVEVVSSGDGRWALQAEWGGSQLNRKPAQAVRVVQGGRGAGGWVASCRGAGPQEWCGHLLELATIIWQCGKGKTRVLEQVLIKSNALQVCGLAKAPASRKTDPASPSTSEKRSTKNRPTKLATTKSNHGQDRPIGELSCNIFSISFLSDTIYNPRWKFFSSSF